MYRKLALLMLVLGVGVPAWAAKERGIISGYVRDAAGVPQMGAMVEVMGSAALTVFTDERGFYRASGLLPGIYNVKVSAPSFLPVLRERVQLSPGASVLLDITLRTLFEAVQLAPGHDAASADDWKWVLRSGANRPILRMVDDQTGVVTADVKTNSRVTGSLAFVAGYSPQGVGSTSDVGTAFSLQRSIFGSDMIGLRGTVGYGSSAPAGALRASFRHSEEGDLGPELALTLQSLPAPGTMPGAGIQALTLAVSDGMKLGHVVELKFGSELQGIQFLGHTMAFRPYGTADVRLSRNLMLEYRYATSLLESGMEEGLGTAELGQINPRVSIANYSSAVESAHHHEGSFSYRDERSTLQAAVYYDRIANPVLSGVGEFSSDGGDVLPDAFTGKFTYRGVDYTTEGVRLVAEHQLTAGLTATVDYALGNTLEMEKTGAALQEARQWMRPALHHAVAGKLSGVIPKSKTQWVASYQWVDGAVLTPVDIFNTSDGRTDPYLSVLIRQPVPGMGFLPGRMEAMVDLRNLLAQGYVPVLGDDGHTVYLVESARAVRGGFSFTF
jgi:hypothetical protein